MNEKNNLNENVKRDAESSPSYLCRLIVTLAAVCVAIAVLLAAVNAVTADKIAGNVIKSKKEAVLTIFNKGTDCELYKTLEDGSEVYLVYREGGVIGYCAYVTSVGFGGDIHMMVGINSAYETEGVKIVSMSETPGVGTKTNTRGFLSQFVGGTHSDPVGKADAVAGATISSDAVKAGVVTAHAAEMDLEAICAEKGCALITPEELEHVSVSESTSESADTTDANTESTSDTAQPSDTEPVSPDTDAEPTEPAETEDIPFVNNPGMKDFIYNVDASRGSDRFVIEIPKDEETATFETTTEPEPVTTEPEVIVTEPQPVVTEPPVTVTEPETTEAEPVVTEETTAEETEDENVIPPWLDTQAKETIPSWLDTQPEETAPSWIVG